MANNINRDIRAKFVASRNSNSANRKNISRQNNLMTYIIGMFIMAMMFAFHFINSPKSQVPTSFSDSNSESLNLKNDRIENPLAFLETRTRPPKAGDVWQGCNDARAAGTAPIYSYEPGYDTKMDGDGDGIACEPHR